jgi:protein-L-isoaspartate(D-aspartate) O-methyltransferase
MFEKLLANGGRLFQVVGQGASASAQLVTRVADEIFHREELFETALPPLINAPEPKRFSF